MTGDWGCPPIFPSLQKPKPPLPQGEGVGGEGFPYRGLRGVPKRLGPIAHITHAEKQPRFGIIPLKETAHMYAVTTEALGRQFGDQWAVRDLTLHIDQGEVFGLLGPNGAGKTTTMRLLACLIAPTTGHASVFGYDVVRNSPEVRTRVGILTEAPGLYGNRSALQNLELYARLYGLKGDHARNQIERYLKLLGLWDERHRPAGTLSKG